MPFTWRELWSCNSPGGLLLGADSSGALVGLVVTNIVRGPRSMVPVPLYGRGYCWNGAFVFSSHGLRHIGLVRYRGDEIDRLDVFSVDSFETLEIVALKDGTLFVHTLSNYALVRNDGDGRMEIFKTGPWDLDRCIVTPWWGGVLFYNVHDEEGYHWHWDATTGETKVLSECELDAWSVAVYLSDPKRCCIVTYDKPRKDAEVIEWDAEGRRQVFPVEKRSSSSTSWRNSNR